MPRPTPFRDIEHLLRLFGLLVLSGVVFLVVRAVLVPGDFGVYGHFRAGAMDDVRAHAMKFAGRAACEECHVDVVEQRAGGAHVGIGCESCHGALADHAADPTEVTPVLPEVPALCVGCHAASPYRPKSFPQVDVDEHSMGESCTECHSPHHPDFE